MKHSFPGSTLPAVAVHVTSAGIVQLLDSEVATGFPITENGREIMAHEPFESHEHDHAVKNHHEHSHEKKHGHDFHSHSHHHEHGHNHAHGQAVHCGCAASCTAGQAAPRPVSGNWPKGQAVFYIDSMDCPVEVNDIKSVLSRIEGIRNLDFQLASRTLSIDADREIVEKSIAAIRKAGYAPERITTGDTETGSPRNEERVWRYWLALAIACVVEILHVVSGDIMATEIGGMILSVVAIWLSGFSTYRKGLAALLGLRLNINALMTVAVTGAFLIGQWPEAAMVMALYAIAELIEARSIDRARNAIRNLLDLTPPTAEIRDETGTWNAIPVKNVTLNATIRVRPGERIPLDGTVTGGAGTVDQSPVTGESIPVDKKPGDSVFAGTINESGTLEFCVTALSDDTVVARIIRAVEEAQEASAPTQRFVDRFAAVYTPLIFLFALCVAVATPFLFGWNMVAGVIQGTCHAGHRLSLCTRDRHTGHCRQRAGLGRTTRHSDERRHLSGRSPQHQSRGFRQDRYDHGRETTSSGHENHFGKLSGKRYSRLGGRSGRQFRPPCIPSDRIRPEPYRQSRFRIHGSGGTVQAGCDRSGYRVAGTVGQTGRPVENIVFRKVFRNDFRVQRDVVSLP